MILLRYNAAKLLLMAGLLLLLLVPLALLYVYPEELERSRRGLARLLSSGFGHDVVLPGLIAICLLFMWRCTATAMGSLIAIEAKEDSLHVTDLWGPQRIAWARLEPIRIERTSTLASASYRLIFRGGRRTAKVPLAITDLRDTPIEALVARIETLRFGARPPEAPRRQHHVQMPATARPAGFGRKEAE